MKNATYAIVALLRHAKAENPSINMQDFDRPLSDFGKKQANLVGVQIEKNIKHPITLICSSSLRTKQTLENLNLKNIAQIQYIDALYSGGLADYIAVIKEYYHLPLLVIGHNPIIAETAYGLWDKQIDGAKFPELYNTATLAILQPPQNNSQDFVGKSKLLDVYRP